MITQLATPQQHRTFAAGAASALTQVAARFASQDAVVALSGQTLADHYRVVAALWTKAGAALDPESAFFRLCSTAFSHASAHEVPGDRVGAGDLVTASRAAWGSVLAGMNIPLVFPAAVVGNQVVDLGAARARLLDGLTVADFVASHAEQARQLTGAQGVRAGVLAYLVDAAEATGDTGLLTVHARLVWLDDELTGAGDEAAAIAAARKVLGPVETVRARDYHPTI